MTIYANNNRKRNLGNTLEAKMAFIERFALFSCLSPEEKLVLANQMEHREKSRYSFVYETGEGSEVLYLLAEGAIKIGATSHDGKEVIKALIHPLAMFGELGLVGEVRRQEFAQVMKEEVVLFAVKVEDFRRLMRQNFELCNRVMLYLGSRLSLAEQKMESLIFKDARTRIVDFIKDSVSDRGQRVGYEMLLRHSLTHQDIANITCTSRQTVTLVLNELRKSDLIYFNRGKILVRDLARLA
ncbi:MAG TPA: Crp/Fnr family transcriptional regulator [Haliscomenobacter sp.]|uniref:Crp/Fnr family transcriptional regulator n=1 Tax=Haliscomenobacter sp. TaxID=2717303 RepID=UPI001DF92068|nr:Crp/Fnr family transcriptional regulator [Haliscomenobacter sp.]MBK9488954.1 Crp/Fnr family transcriptional regulator [Haliscomenobacter sp.]HOY16933.1 Crp/Fnr family transcriptional regulator [Haliscomenobacter sp.]HPH21491.1 Crp/Fnr family transcriptional regulator [Haliscomenobacter sp.]